MLATVATAAPSGAQTQTQLPAYRNPGLSFAERAANLVSQMTLEEKAGQLSTTSQPAIPRLGVQEHALWNEAQHGISVFTSNYTGDAENLGPFAQVAATSFPTNFAASMSWNPGLIRRETAAISDEARGFLDPALFGVAQNNLGPTPGRYGSLFYFAPTINILRDPRWGRNDEAFGEDPLLTGTLGSAWVNGFQGQTAGGRPRGRYLKAVATLKHYALNNVENDRTAVSSNTSERAIRDYYTPHFRQVLEDAHAGSIMSSYNAVNGTPAVASASLLNELARRTWGHTGHVASDCGAVATTYRDPTQAIGIPGTALFFRGHGWAPPGWTTDRGGEQAQWTRQADGLQVSGQAGGEAFTLRAGTDLNCVGDNGQPGAPGFGDVASMFTGSENRIDYIREAIAAGILSEDVIDRALIRVYTLRMRTGEFDPPANQPYTRIDRSVIESEAHRALAQRAGEQSLVLLKNTKPQGSAAKLLPVDPERLDKVVILGDQAGNAFLGGYSGAPTEQVSLREGLEATLKAANPAVTLTYDAAGTSSTATGPASLTPTIRAQIEAADLVVVMVGTDEKTNSEGSDRAGIEMPGNYDSLVDQVATVGNPRIALVVQAGAPVELGAVRDRVASILFSGPNGQRQGLAAASVLTGAHNPSARLSQTWYRDDSQLPPMDDYDLAPAETGGIGRTYQHLTRKPEYPFGFGLSYTSFRWSQASLNRSAMGANGTVTASVRVKNTGNRAGATVVQLYAVPPEAGRKGRAKRRLAGFRRTRVLRPGRSQTVRIAVPVAERLRSWSARRRRSVVIPGRWRLEVSRAAGRITESLPLRIGGRISRKVRHVTVEPPRAVLEAGETLKLRGRNPWLTGLGGAKYREATRIIAAVRHDDSFVDLRRQPIRFRSNRPGILGVSRRGKVRAVRPGVATVSVRIGGVRGETVFVVRSDSAQPGAASSQ